MNLIPAKTKAPVSKTSTERLKLAFQHYWTENKFLKEKIYKLQSKIKKPSMKVSAELGDDMVTICQMLINRRYHPSWCFSGRSSRNT